MFIWIIIGIIFSHLFIVLSLLVSNWKPIVVVGKIQFFFSNHSIKWYNHVAKWKTKWQHWTEITTIKYRIEICHLSEWVVTSIETQAHISATTISSMQIHIVRLLCMLMINVSNVNCVPKSSYTCHCVY